MPLWHLLDRCFCLSSLKVERQVSPCTTQSFAESSAMNDKLLSTSSTSDPKTLQDRWCISAGPWAQNCRWLPLFFSGMPGLGSEAKCLYWRSMLTAPPLTSSTLQWDQLASSHWYSSGLTGRIQTEEGLWEEIDDWPRTNFNLRSNDTIWECKPSIDILTTRLSPWLQRRYNNVVMSR